MYIIAFLLLILVISSKYHFIIIEGIQKLGSFEIASFLLATVLTISGTFLYFKNNFPLKFRFKLKRFGFGKFSFYKLLLIVLFLGFVFSLYINFNKPALSWDAIALYDARAKYLLEGVNFSQMVDLSKYDPQNSYYYLLYPPFTSQIHYFWHKLLIPVPIGVYYSIMLFLIGVVVYVFARKKFNPLASIILVFVTVLNNTIFSVSLSEYTNLPFILNLLLGIFLLAEYLEDRQKWKVIFGLLLVVSSQWIRYLEPLWIGVLLAFVFTTIKANQWKKQIVFIVLAIVYGLSEYIGWGSFIQSFGKKTEVVSFSVLRFIEPIVGIFTGTAASILKFFVLSWGIILLIHFLVIIMYTDKKNWLFSSSKNTTIQFFRLIIMFTILIYFLGLYFVSFQSSWWGSLGNSLVRSASFLIPISGYLLLLGVYKPGKIQKTKNL
jgi:hypothetical protein